MFDKHRKIVVSLIGFLLLAQQGAEAAQSCSAAFCIQQSTVNAAGASASSGNFRLNASLGQEMTIGVSSSPHFVLQSGFWSYFGSGLVPVLLMVTKNATNPTHPDLSWSGNNPPYFLYREADCSDVFTGGFIANTGLNSYTDAPPAATLLCYNVLATAPGTQTEAFSPNPDGSSTTLIDYLEKIRNFKSKEFESIER